MDELAKAEEYYLGFDLSTQQLKAIVLEAIPAADDHDAGTAATATNRTRRGGVRHEESVAFDALGFGTQSGVHVADGDAAATAGRVTAPVRMWLKAVELLLNRLKSKVDLSRVSCVGGCAQQHGTVYWGDAAKLHQMDPSRSLDENLEKAFTIDDCPIWMDSSTTAECRKLEAAVGGPLALAQLTGSRAHERYSGPQIARIARTRSREYLLTERISLVSSFLCSLFVGRVAPIDLSDGSGMNLMDINTNSWSSICLRACFAGTPQQDDEGCATDLLKKLGGSEGLVPTGSDLGVISDFMQLRFGFAPHCHVAAFTGDNSASFVGLGLRPNKMVLSLGSSDTLLFWRQKGGPVLEHGHLFCNPLNSDALMGLLCFKNGSLMRDKIAKEHAQGDWTRFNALLRSTPPGNGGRVGVYFDLPEILPPQRQGRFLFQLSGEHESVTSAAKVPVVAEQTFTDADHVRALIEGQLMCRRLYLENAQSLGAMKAAAADDGDYDDGGVGELRHSKPIRQQQPHQQLIVTGGASVNRALCQVIADIFNMPVAILSNGSVNSAAVGAAILAYRCRNHDNQNENGPPRTGANGSIGPPHEFFESETEIVARPQHWSVYEKLLPCFRQCLQQHDLL